MRNPLIVEAAEDLFVPVLVYNNKQEDAKLLKHFREPSWNNPIVRYMTSKEKDLTPRKDLVLTTAETASRMVSSLKAADKEVPVWLDALAVPTKRRQLRQATFSMY